MKDRICTSCYHVGQPTSQGMGSFAVDIFMWMMFFSLSMFSSIFLLMLVPLAWTTYHVAIYNKSTCPECGRLDMVSLTSAKGKKALAGPSVVVSYRASEDPDRKDEVEQPQQHRRASDNGEQVGRRRTSDAA